MKKRTTLLKLSAAALCTLPFLFTSCTKKSDADASASPASYPYKVTATIGMISDIVREVGGDKVEVETIIGEGIDPHTYKPRRADVEVMNKSSVIFYNGLMLEGKMGDALINVARGGKPVHAVTEKIQESKNFILTDEEDHYDPHVWMDPKGWSLAVDVITQALSDFDQANADYYQTNATSYKEKLVLLHNYTEKCLATVPEKQRVLITAHDAFGYMARAYDIKVMGVQGLSTESEAGVRRIEDLVSYIVENKIPAVFIESSVSDKNVKALIEGAKAKGHDVKIGGELFSDAMGPAGTYTGTYIGMIDHNATIITRALGGDAPEAGMQGKLK